MTAPRTGIMVVGLRGYTASCLEAGLLSMQSGMIDERFGATSTTALDGPDLPGSSALVVGGWDLHARTLTEVLHEYRHLPATVVAALGDAPGATAIHGVVSPVDYAAAAPSSDVRRSKTLEDGATLVAQDIEAFRDAAGVGHVVVVNLGSPSQRPDSDQFELDLASLLSRTTPGSAMYCLGAIWAGADFVDFAPSSALEFQALWSEAARQRTRLMGRDGSTGQTMLKVTLAEMLRRRGLALSSWYSTNLIGNPDGLALSKETYSVEKRHDKTDALDATDLQGDHHVEITYLPHWGDRKEAWDAIESTSWLGSELSLRVTWRGSDSELAAPLALDLVRLASRARDRGMAGFVPETGFFFKRPFLRESTSISQRWAEVVDVLGPASCP